SNFSVNEGGSVAITGLSITDDDDDEVDSVTFSVLTGTLTFRTNVSGGLNPGDFQGTNGTASVTIVDGTPLSEINATLAAANGLTYEPEGTGDDTITITPTDSNGL